jgi:GT2 family glycosyltransferase
MFMLFRPEMFSAVGGFDEGYHLYYEDVDICARLKVAGCRIVACPGVFAIHSARRESHQNLRYMKWHLQSMIRFFLSRSYRNALALKST